MDIVFMIVILVALIAMMWWQSRKAKQQQQERKDFRENLQPGTEIITIGGIIGKVVSVDVEYEEIVIDSEGSLLRFGFNAIKPRVQPVRRSCMTTRWTRTATRCRRMTSRVRCRWTTPSRRPRKPAEVIETSEAGDTADTESK